MSIEAILVDDEPLARRGVRQLLERHDDVEVVAECDDGFEAVDRIRELRPDLVFLDIQMPGMDGFEVLSGLERDYLPAVVFITAYDEHALRAFRVHAVDYLLKPVREADFHEAMRRVRDRLDAPDPAGDELRVRALLERMAEEREGGTETAAGRHPRRILVREGDRAFFVRTADILWFASAGNYVRLATPSGTHLIRATMTEVERRLDPEQFVRIHRKTIVNLDRIREIRQTHSYDYFAVLADGSEHRVSRGYRDRLLGSA